MNANVVAAEEPLGRCPEVFDSRGSSWEVKRVGGGSRNSESSAWQEGWSIILPWPWSSIGGCSCARLMVQGPTPL